MFQLHAISSGNETATSFAEKAHDIYDIVDYIHIRERSWTVKDYETAIRLVKAYDPTLQKIIINDRADMASMYGVQRVHLPEHSYEPAQIRAHFPHLEYGCAVHQICFAQSRAREQAKYVMYGHIFHTTCKKDLKPRGLRKLSELVHAVTIPVIAVGGITADNISAVMDTGAAGAAVMSNIFSVENVRKSAQAYKDKILEKGSE